MGHQARSQSTRFAPLGVSTLKPRFFSLVTYRETDQFKCFLADPHANWANLKQANQGFTYWFTFYSETSNTLRSGHPPLSVSLPLFLFQSLPMNSLHPPTISVKTTSLSLATKPPDVLDIRVPETEPSVFSHFMDMVSGYPSDKVDTNLVKTTN